MTNNFNGYVDSDYLSAAKSLFAPIKQRSYVLMGDLLDKQVLDIGCGPGLDTIALATLVGKKGRVEGIDYDPAMVEEATSLTDSNNQSHKVHHQVASATDLPFADNHFDAVRSERLLMHLTEPECALAEAVRVTKPNGRVVVVDTDWGSLSTHTGADNIERRLVQFLAESFLANGYSGRRLRGLFAGQALREVRIETDTIHTADLNLWQLMTQANRVAEVALERGILTDSEIQQWQDALHRSAENDTFFGSVSVVTATGTVSGA